MKIRMEPPINAVPNQAFRPWPLGLWLPIVIGLIALYVPSLYGLVRGIWSSDEQAHGPMVLGIACWLFYSKWREMWLASEGHQPSWLGWPVLLIGLLLYVVGRSQDILIFEIGSVIWLLAGMVLAIRGWAAIRVQWFSLFFMVFMIPLPGPLVDAVTLPMKLAVSDVTEHVLYWAGYPIARTGVILQIGKYALLVADACSGLHTLFALEALGLLYLNVVKRDSFLRNLGLALLIAPISFSANVLRVIALVLITYHLGDAAGQGFLHGFAGLVLFGSALMFIMGLDSALHFVLKRYGHKVERVGSRA